MAETSLWVPPALHLLPRENATPLEIALDLGLEAPVLDIPVPLRDLWRWDTCPEDLLPWLAWAMSVDLWSDAWPIERQREIIRDSFKLHRLKGTLGGIKRYVELVDSRVTRAIVPPQSPFWAPHDQASIDRWEETLPEVRIYPRREPGTGDGFYFDADYTDDDGEVPGAFYEANRAPEDGGDRIVFYRDGVETEIDWIQSVHPAYGSHTQLGLPGSAGPGHFLLGEDYFDEAHYTSAADFETDVVALPPLPPEDIRAGWYRVTRVTPDFVDDGGSAGLGHHYLGDGILDDGPDNALDGDYYAGNEAPWQVYRRWFLFSPASEPGDPDGWSYYDDFRYGMPPHTAELWVDIPETAPRDHAYDSIDDFFGEHDLSRLWKTAEAIDLSKSLRDQVLIETELRRLPKFGDRRRFGTFKFGDYLPRAH